MTSATDHAVGVIDSEETFESNDPATGEVVGTWPVQGKEAVVAAVGRARAASQWWGAQGFDGRRRHLKAWKGVLARSIHELADLVHRENGKPHADAMLEITLAIDHIEWAGRPRRQGARVPARCRPGCWRPTRPPTVEYQPFGVIGVIGPWNYPGLHADGLDRLRPGGRERRRVQAQRVHAGHRGVAGVGLGAGRPRMPRRAPARHRPGSRRAPRCAGPASTSWRSPARRRPAKKVMAACAENLVPVLMECGGKDAMIVDDDADVAAAADAALWGGMSNAGQTCIGIERVYATERVYDAFVARAHRPGRASSGPDRTPRRPTGPITMPGQLDVIKRHIADATDRGGRAAHRWRRDRRLCRADGAGRRPRGQRRGAGGDLRADPHRRQGQATPRRPSSGPTPPPTAWPARSSPASTDRGMDLARRMRSGMTCVNWVIAFASVPSLPFGGVGDSGFGRIHGDDGLKRVHPGQGDHPAAIRPAGGAAFIFPSGQGDRLLGDGGQVAARPAVARCGCRGGPSPGRQATTSR